MRKKHFVVCYDISDPRRLQRIQRLVSKQLLQIQYSMYYGTMYATDMDKLIEQLKRLIDEQDFVKVYETESIETAFIKGKRSSDVMLLGENGEQIHW